MEEKSLEIIVNNSPLGKVFGGEGALAVAQAFMRSGSEEKMKSEIAFFGQIVRKFEKPGKPNALLKCDPKSIGDAFINIAACGTTLNPVVQHAFLVPRDGKCCLDFSYRGLSDQVCRGGNVLVINASPVYEGDFFEFKLGTGAYINHVPLELKENPTPQEVKDLKERAASPWRYIRFVYSVAKLRGGVEDFIVLPKWKIEKAKSASKTSTVWSAYPEEQARKTGIRYHCKTLPISPSAAMAVSLTHELDGADFDKGGPKQSMSDRLMADQNNPHPKTEYAPDDQGRPF